MYIMLFFVFSKTLLSLTLACLPDTPEDGLPTTPLFQADMQSSSHTLENGFQKPFFSG